MSIKGCLVIFQAKAISDCRLWALAGAVDIDAKAHGLGFDSPKRAIESADLKSY